MWKTMKRLFGKKPVPVCQTHFYDVGKNGTCPVCGVTMKWDTEEVA